MSISKRLMLCGFALSIVLGYQQSVLSQDKLPQPIYSGTNLSTVLWSFAGQALYFINLHESAAAYTARRPAPWRTYDPISGTLQENAASPYTSGISAADVNQFQPAIYGGWLSALYPSPDQKYMIYIPQQECYELCQLALANLATGESDPTPIRAQSDYRVIWNTTSTAFVVYFRRSQDMPYWAFHGEGFLSNLSLLFMTRISENVINSHRYQLFEPFDISDYGENVLVLVLDRTRSSGNSEDAPHHLMLWNARYPSQSRVLENLDAKTVIGATFAPNDESKILFVDANGLSEYDLTTNVIRLIDGRINETWVRQELNIRTGRSSNYWRHEALFSPDKRWVALYLDGWNESESKLYVLPTGR